MVILFHGLYLKDQQDKGQIVHFINKCVNLNTLTEILDISEFFAMNSKERNEFNTLFDGVSIGEGFFAGVYFSIGFDPVGTIFNLSTQAIINIDPNSVFLPTLKAYAWIPTILTIVVFILTYIIYRELGITSVMFALISGLIVLHYPTLGSILLLASAGLAYLAVHCKNSNNYGNY
jgi:hypothetical protein